MADAASPQPYLLWKVAARTVASFTVSDSERIFRTERRSARAPARKHYGQRPEHDDQVGKRRPCARILRVESDALRECSLVSSADLPEAGNSRPHRAINCKLLAIELDLVDHDRAGADNTHF